MLNRSPVFLARRGYRLRRAMDAARLVPVLGGFLFLIPLLWGGGSTRTGVIFVFAVWLGLIGLAGFLARILAGEAGTGGETAERDSPAERPRTESWKDGSV